MLLLLYISRLFENRFEEVGKVSVGYQHWQKWKMSARQFVTCVEINKPNIYVHD